MACICGPSYDRQMEDLFAIQDEIAAAIAGELKLRFASDRRPRRQPNLKAYEAYLRYRQFQWGFTPESLRRSRECLEQAIALDPEYALPYVGLADHHSAVVGPASRWTRAFHARANSLRAPWNWILSCRFTELKSSPTLVSSETTIWGPVTVFGRVTGDSYKAQDHGDA